MKYFQNVAFGEPKVFCAGNRRFPAFPLYGETQEGNLFKSMPVGSVKFK